MRIILGIDPGLASTGYGVLRCEGNRFRHGTRLLRFRDDKGPRNCTWREVRPPRGPDDPTVESLLAP